jgi:hypothetical protein
MRWILADAREWRSPADRLAVREFVRPPGPDGCRQNACRLVVVFGHVLFVDWVRPALAGEITEDKEPRHVASDCPCRNPLE